MEAGAGAGGNRGSRRRVFVWSQHNKCELVLGEPLQSCSWSRCIVFFLFFWVPARAFL